MEFCETKTVIKYAEQKKSIWDKNTVTRHLLEKLTQATKCPLNTDIKNHAWSNQEDWQTSIPTHPPTEQENQDCRLYYRPLHTSTWWTWIWAKQIRIKFTKGYIVPIIMVENVLVILEKKISKCIYTSSLLSSQHRQDPTNQQTWILLNKGCSVQILVEKDFFMWSMHLYYSTIFFAW